MFKFNDDLYSRVCCLYIRCYENHVHRKEKHGTPLEEKEMEMEMTSQLDLGASDGKSPQEMRDGIIDELQKVNSVSSVVGITKEKI